MSTATAPARSKSAARKTLSTMLAAEVAADPWQQAISTTPAPSRESQPAAPSSPAIVLLAFLLVVVAMASTAYFVVRCAWSIGQKVAISVGQFVQFQLGGHASPQSWIDLKDLLGHVSDAKKS